MGGAVPAAWQARALRPEWSLCLYQDRDFNGTSDARIWIITDDVERLSAYDANDRASSAYFNVSSRWTARLCADAEWTGGSALLTSSKNEYPHLNNVTGNAGDGTGYKVVWLNDNISSVGISKNSGW
ncbi:peptidase inhibitor family I36 protein [Streptomyces sp. NPDC057539]|uniref:peptidase inhibitor family I36 protein n=1 Tax=Streptomyces sp. NPDC057539 TaxID=3346159 RepID=UPI003678AD2C